MPLNCSVRHKITSKCMQVVESIIAKLLLVISICSIIYSNNWLSVFINFAFLLLALFSMITYAQCYKRVSPVLAIPMLVNQTVFIFWIFIWIYASITSITTGHLWSLEWLGGPKSSREVGSRDVLDPNYINPNETHPETKKSIKLGAIIMGASLVVMVLKIIGWRIAKTTYEELRQRRLQMIEKTEETESDLGAPSPPIPVVTRNRAPKVDAPPTYDQTMQEGRSFLGKDRHERSSPAPSNYLESTI